MVFASVTGSDSAGSATAVESLIRDVATAAVASETQGSRVRCVAVVRQRSVAGAGVSGFPLDGDVGVLRHVEGIEAAILAGLGCLAGVIPRSQVNRTMPWRMAQD